MRSLNQPLRESRSCIVGAQTKRLSFASCNSATEKLDFPEIGWICGSDTQAVCSRAASSRSPCRPSASFDGLVAQMSDNGAYGGAVQRGVADFVDVARQILADQARRHFEAELLVRGPARRDDMVTAIAVLTSVESWQQYRHSHHRSPAEIRRAWRSTVAGILTEPGRPSPDGSRR